MAKKKKRTTMKPTRPPPLADRDADLDIWRLLMLDTYLPDASSNAERRHVNMHVAILD